MLKTSIKIIQSSNSLRVITFQFGKYSKFVGPMTEKKTATTEIPDLLNKKNLRIKIQEYLEDATKKSPLAVKKVLQGAKHVKEGFVITYQDAVYLHGLSKISNKSIT